MRSDKSQLSSLTTRQKVMGAVLAVVVVIIIWQIYGLFGGGSSTTVTPAPALTHVGAQPGAPSATGPRPPAMPQPAELIKAQPQMTQREMELSKLQQETQAKYIAALNELQVLRVSRDIAETTQAIMTAKLATVTAEKNIVNLLAPPQQLAPADYARGLVTPTPGGVTQNIGGRPATPTTAPAAAPRESTYTAISVSQLQYRWSAVLGYQGNLYNVHIGDVLPADGSKVISIDKSGVVLEKNGERKKISMVPII
jgi:type IV pilus biogenesis protein PilP